MRISAMVLVGENEPYLKYAIESIKDIVDEIILLNAGEDGVPSDEALKLHDWNHATGCLGCNEKIKYVIQEEQATDFASWRNQALKECTGQYCLVLDADEILAKPDGSPCSRELLEEIIKNNKDAYHIFTIHFLYNYRWIDGRNNGVHHSQCRLFKNENVKFEGKIHEYLLKEQEYQPEHSGLNKPIKMWSRPEKFGIVNNPCIWHFGGCKGMEDLRIKYARTRDIEGNPFAEAHKQFKDNDAYCAAHPLFRMERPMIFWDKNLPSVLRLW